MKAFKQHKDNLLLPIRIQLGLNQVQMAEHIGMGYTAYKMAELGKRPVTTAALVKIAGLETRLKDKDLQPCTEKPHCCEAGFIKHHRREFELLFAKELSYRKQLPGLQLKLERLKHHYKKCREWLAVLDDAAREVDDHNPVKALEKQQQVAIKRLERCNLPVQLLLKIKIELLEAEASLYRSMQEKLRKELPEFFEGGGH